MTDAPHFADPAAALPLHVVAPDALPAWLEALPDAWRGWLIATGFAAGLGETCLLPGPDGQPAAAVTGLGTDTARRRIRFGLAKAAASLPGRDWPSAVAASPFPRRGAGSGLRPWARGAGRR